VRRFPSFLTLASAFLLVSACGDPVGSNSHAPSTATANPDAKSGLWFEPAALSSCESNALVKVYWSAGAREGVKAVNVLTIRPNGEEAIFASHASPSGMKRTGRWIRADRQFVVRDANGGAELARASVGTLPCPEVQDAPKP
jgi:hypothetical protein